MDELFSSRLQLLSLVGTDETDNPSAYWVRHLRPADLREVAVPSPLLLLNKHRKAFRKTKLPREQCVRKAVSE